MKYRMPSYYKQFKCVADKCPDTCCAGWAIVIDDKTYDSYMQLDGDKGEYVRGHIDKEEKVYKRNGVRCSFLNDNNLCELYINVGEDKLCKTCGRYPRHFEEYGNLVEAALSMSCPIAAKMMIDAKEIDRFLVKQDEKKSRYSAEVDEHLLEALLKVRRDMFKLMADRTVSVWERATRILELGEIIQPAVYEYEKLGWRKYIGKNRTRVLDSITTNQVIPVSLTRDDLDAYGLIQQFMDMLLGLENINDAWPEMISDVQTTLYKDIEKEEYIKLHQEFSEYMNDRQYEYEHIITYFLYTYFLGSVYDYNVQAMVKLAVLCGIIIREMGLCQWLHNGKEFTVDEQVTIAYLFSRQLEHSENNMLSLEGLLVAHPVLQKDNILITCQV